jgi:D-alanyl-lipoteichoic acid acyltransferase DltB (MBOAT superfamily)
VILGLELTLFVYLFAAALFWIIRYFSHGAAMVMLIVVNCVFLFLASPLLSVYLAAQVGLVCGLYALCRAMPQRASTIAWFAFLGLVPVNLQLWIGDVWSIPAQFGEFGSLSMPNVFWALGASFFVVKSFVMLKEALAAGKVAVLPSLAGLTFLPAFSAGPIHGTAVWTEKNVALAIPPRVVLEIVLKIGWGAAALYVISPWLRDQATSASDGILGVVPEMYLRFAGLFFDFSGYTVLAIAAGQMFGVKLPENFNRPYLATSIREFWQRWHMSLSWFVGTYLFKPFVRKTGSAPMGIFLAFVCVGLWHEFTPGYLLWGIGHGAALSLAMKPPAAWVRLNQALPSWGSKALGWFLTMTWVALLSHIATIVLGG